MVVHDDGVVFVAEGLNVFLVLFCFRRVKSGHITLVCVFWRPLRVTGHVLYTGSNTGKRADARVSGQGGAALPRPGPRPTCCSSVSSTKKKGGRVFDIFFASAKVVPDCGDVSATPPRPPTHLFRDEVSTVCVCVCVNIPFTTPGPL